MSRALRYLPEGRMSSINQHQGHQDRVAENVGLMRRLSSHLNGTRPIERDSEKTDRVLGTKIVRQKTVGYLGRTQAAINGSFDKSAGICLSSYASRRSRTCQVA